MPIASFIKASALEAHIAALTNAFAQAWARIEASGSPLARDGNPDAARTVLAKWIISRVQAGDVEVGSLIEGAIIYMAEINYRCDRLNGRGWAVRGHHREWMRCAWP